MGEEREQIARANRSRRQPVVFVHGLWLLPSSWERWSEMFEAEGFATLTPGWPDDPPTTAEANAHPEALARKSIAQVADYVQAVIAALDRKPILVGHSFGGLLVQLLAGRGLAAATVAIDPAAFQGVLPLPFSALRSAWPVLKDPRNRHRALPLPFEQFQYAFANALDEGEARELYAAYVVPGAGEPLFQAAAANLNPWTEDKVDTARPDRGPLLIISGDQDHTVPRVVAEAAYRLQARNSGVTEFVEMPGRGHSLVIDHGWREVAEATLGFVRRLRTTDAVGEDLPD